VASLKALRARINSVKSTRKITSAMKMVAASKLKRAQNQAEAARPYAERMERVLAALGASVAGSPTAPRLLAGTGRDQVHLVVAITADRGLAGAFNTQVGRAARALIRRLEGEGKTVKVLTAGRKGRDYLRRENASVLVGEASFGMDKKPGQAGGPASGFAAAEELGQRIVRMFEAGEFDVCTIVYNRFASVISQVATEQQLIPLVLPAGGTQTSALYEFEPDEETMLAALLPRNLGIQLYRAALESSAGEHAARMTAMDNATRNAGDMINRLTLNYNRTRQANITRELIEIISGAEAV
jgi:F-type H+-transporting ATPase subunit gamma